MSSVVLEVHELRKRYCRDLRRSRAYGIQDIVSDLFPWPRAGPDRLRRGEFWALDDISFEVSAGEALGVLGANGAGKTTLLRVLHGTTKPTGGSFSIRGTSMALIDIGSSFSGTVSGRENIASEASLLGMSPNRTERLIDDVTDFADLGDFIDAPVDSYSSGMRVRLGFAIAAQCEPEVLLVDETIAVGDIDFQRKCVNHVREMLDRGSTLVLVSHDLWMINALCDRCIVLDSGRITHRATTAEAVVEYVAGLKPLPVKDARGDESTHDHAQATPSDRPVVTIRSATLSGLDGRAPRFGAPAEIRLQLEHGSKIGPVQAHVVVRGANQQTNVLATASGSDADLVALRGPTTDVRGRIESFPLFGGRFYIEVILVNRAGDVLGEFGTGEAASSLEVGLGTGETEKLAHMAGALGSMPATFSVRDTPT